MDAPQVSEDEGYAISDRDELWNEEGSPMRAKRARQKEAPGYTRRNRHHRGAR
jgi:hypothetical protein